MAAKQLVMVSFDAAEYASVSRALLGKAVPHLYQSTSLTLEQCRTAAALP